MIAEEIVFGLVCIAWSCGLLYYSKGTAVSPVVKSFFSVWWIRSERVNKTISAIFGYCGLTSGLAITLAGIVGWDIWPR